MRKTVQVEKVCCDLCGSEITDKNAPDTNDTVDVMGKKVLVDVVVRTALGGSPLDACRSCLGEATRFMGRGM